MNVVLIGFGQAGGVIVDEFYRYERQNDRSFIRGTLAINAAKADLLGLQRVPEERRVLIGQSRVKGHGVGADLDLGTEIVEEDIDEIQGGIDGLSMKNVDAFVIVAGLGGGTGAGGAPVLANHLERIYPIPVYGLGILPDSSEGGIYTRNAARSLPRFIRAFDNVLLFDNDAWGTADAIGDYEEINTELVRQFGSVFSDRKADTDTSLPIVESTDVIETLDEGDIATVGFAADDVERPSDGLLSSLTGRKDEVDRNEAINRITSLTRKSVLGKLALPCDFESAKRALLLLSGPPEYLESKGVKRGKQWLEEQIESEHVHTRVAPNEASRVAATVLLSGISDGQRIAELEEKGPKTDEQIEELKETTPDDLEDIVPGEKGESQTETGSKTTPEADAAGKTAGVEGTASEPESQAVSPETDESDAPTEESQKSSVDRSKQRVGENEIPDTIPKAPKLDVAYEDLDIGDRLGSGGNADVHEARGPNGERLAVKLPRFDGTLHADDIERVLDEAETWSKLDDNDHIADIVDYGGSPAPWIAMEFMDGGTLSSRIGDISFPEAIWIANRIAGAIEFAHRRGVVHLDLKPENVLFRSTPNGQFDVPKVADWGLSKLLLDHSGSVEGLSTKYAAPEQFDSEAYGTPNDRTDVYQLGVIAYELFTGTVPFEGSPASVMNSILNDTPEPPTARDPSLPDAVDEVVMKALRSEKSDRYEHVVLFRRALEDLSVDQPD